MTTNTSADADKATADKDQKCAHPSCMCPVPPDRPFGKYCGEHCENAGEMDELRCECGHDACLAVDISA